MKPFVELYISRSTHGACSECSPVHFIERRWRLHKVEKDDSVVQLRCYHCMHQAVDRLLFEAEEGQIALRIHIGV